VNSLFGSRIGVASAELRLPLVSRAAVGGVVLPIDAHLFSDVGTAWRSGTRPSLTAGVSDDAAVRGLLTSVGAGLRTNLFGYAILEADYVRALESERGWHWLFTLQPGF
jgi:outer membrane protein assembly factor BamA